MRLSVLLALTLITAFTSLAGCSRNITLATEFRTLHADDAFPLQRYTLFQWDGDGRTHDHPAGVLFYVQGSSDHSVLAATEQFAGACVMGLDVAAIERRGVSRDGSIDHVTAVKYATKTCRVADHLALVRAYLDEHPGISPVIIFGTSEGCDVAAAVASREPRVSHVILLAGGGGWTQAQEFDHFVRTRPGSIPGINTPDQLAAKLDDIRANPNADTMWFGHPYRRWSSYMFARPADELLSVAAPILAIHGDADQSVPVESARALRDAFAAAGKTNLTYKEYAGVDHSFTLVPSGKSVRPWIEIDTIEWLAAHNVVDRATADAFVSRVKANHKEWYKPR